ncbi:MAG: cyclic nucleotide-binding domain-containing protein [Methylococcales bacterium]
MNEPSSRSLYPNLHLDNEDNVYQLFTKPRTPLAPHHIEKTKLFLHGKSPYQKNSYNEAIDALVSQSPLHTYEANTRIMHDGHNMDSLFYIISGTVTLYMVDDQFNEVVLNYVTEGNFIGAENLCHANGTAGLSAVSKTNITIAECSHSRFIELAEQHPSLFSMAFTQVTSGLVNIRKRYTGSLYLKVIDQIQDVLRSVIFDRSTEETDDAFIVIITRTEISKIVGCSREMIGRVLNELENKQFLKKHGNTRKLTIYKKSLSESKFTNY